MSLHPLQLGATLYIPTTRLDLREILFQQKIPHLKSVVLCLEDAVSEQDIPLALRHLKQVLSQLKTEQSPNTPLIFIRPRHLEMLQYLLSWQDIDGIHGFVLPKFDLTYGEDYLNLFHGKEHFYLMPTLETAQIFDVNVQRDLVQLLKNQSKNILALRVGGNDLLNCLSLRRPFMTTIYQTPIGTLMGQLCGQFLSQGFALTAPVFEHFSQIDLFQQELTLDVQYGFSGKTIIHPNQIQIVHQAFQVSPQDYQQAQAILNQQAKAVFSHHGSMLEPATHQKWAERILLRAEIYGIG